MPALPPHDMEYDVTEEEVATTSFVLPVATTNNSSTNEIEKRFGCAESLIPFTILPSYRHHITILPTINKIFALKKKQQQFHIYLFLYVQTD